MAKAMLRAVSVVPFQAIAMRSPERRRRPRRRDQNRPAALEEDGLEGRFARQPKTGPGLPTAMTSKTRPYSPTPVSEISASPLQP